MSITPMGSLALSNLRFFRLKNRIKQFYFQVVKYKNAGLTLIDLNFFSDNKAGGRVNENGAAGAVVLFEIRI